MNNLPWEPCPRCEEKNVEIWRRSDIIGSRIATVTIIALIAFVVWKVYSWTHASPIALLLLLAFLALCCGWLVVPLISASGILVGLVTTFGVKGYHAKCKVCSYEWEITEERAKELQAQTPAR